MCVGREKLEIADCSAAEQPADLLDMLACMRAEAWQNFGIAGVRECRNFRKHGFAERAHRRLLACAEQRRRTRNDAALGEYRQRISQSPMVVHIRLNACELFTMCEPEVAADLPWARSNHGDSHQCSRPAGPVNPTE